MMVLVFDCVMGQVGPGFSWCGGCDDNAAKSRQRLQSYSTGLVRVQQHLIWRQGHLLWLRKHLLALAHGRAVCDSSVHLEVEGVKRCGVTWWCGVK